MERIRVPEGSANTASWLPASEAAYFRWIPRVEAWSDGRHSRQRTEGNAATTADPEVTPWKTEQLAAFRMLPLRFENSNDLGFFRKERWTVRERRTRYAERNNLQVEVRSRE